MNALYALPPGADFPAALVAGLEARLAGRPPEDWARTTILVNSGRMARRVSEVLSSGPPRLLPRIAPVSDLEGLGAFPEVPQARSALALTLELAGLIEALIDRDPTLGPRAAAFDLARSLAALIDEMEGEDVPPQALARIDVAGHAAHWQRSRAVVEAAYAHFGGESLPGAEARRARIVDALIARWQEAPPDGPVIVAGSTGSRGATRRLMEAVARLAEGWVVLPGFDTHMPADHWAALDSAHHGEDHPQYRFLGLIEALGLTPADVAPWHGSPAPDPARNRLVSLALCPAPVTDRWRAEGAALGDPAAASARLALLEAPSPRAEAGAIALRLRAAVDEGKRAALISPDRDLTRQVAAALDRWGIEPDDSGGTPLHQSPPGRLLRLTAALMAAPPELPDLLALLKHPLAATGTERGPHLLATRELELYLREARIPRPGAADLAAFAEKRQAQADWASWLAALLEQAASHRAPCLLAERIAAHLALAEAVAAGPSGTPPGTLWDEAAGRAARAAMDALAEAAPAHTGPLAARAYGDLLRLHLSGEQVQDPRLPHPQVMIWGTLEARAGGVDIAILAGLNEGTWPGLPGPDPWLNRRMRAEAGLTLPERQIGLSAHDFQQAIAAPEAMLTRATRDAEAETVPSRWLNRLTNLLKGLGPEGANALDAMERRGREWLDLHVALEVPEAPVAAAPRPSPRPPLAARPKALSVTRITTLIRDPYAIYAQHVLGLRRLAPLLPRPDARARGIALHDTMEAFLASHAAWRGDPQAARAALAEASAALDAHAHDPAMAALWRARLMGVAERLIAGEAERLADAEPVFAEEKGVLPLAGLDFTLEARPDRIDRVADGTYAVRDYKSGSPPTLKQVRAFDKQLPLEAAMAERGAFPGLPAAAVTAMTYIALGASGADREIPVQDEGARLPDRAFEELHALIAAYAVRDRGYTARRAAETVRFEGDYDHLARLGEWDLTDAAVPERVGEDDA
ncbi:MAG: double-strand break repair protein AddB [Paracoccaceae bacterium]|nr:double-strand break repair protein AddB [Paracoccaceae bacterium]